jgi:hypothetical protein
VIYHQHRSHVFDGLILLSAATRSSWGLQAPLGFTIDNFEQPEVSR